MDCCHRPTTAPPDGAIAPVRALLAPCTPFTNNRNCAPSYVNARCDHAPTGNARSAPTPYGTTPATVTARRRPQRAHSLLALQRRYESAPSAPPSANPTAPPPETPTPPPSPPTSNPTTPHPPPAPARFDPLNDNAPPNFPAAVHDAPSTTPTFPFPDDPPPPTPTPHQTQYAATRSLGCAFDDAGQKADQGDNDGHKSEPKPMSPLTRFRPDAPLSGTAARLPLFAP